MLYYSISLCGLSFVTKVIVTIEMLLFKWCLFIWQFCSYLCVIEPLLVMLKCTGKPSEWSYVEYDLSILFGTTPLNQYKFNYSIYV